MANFSPSCDSHTFVGEPLRQPDHQGEPPTHTHNSDLYINPNIAFSQANAKLFKSNNTRTTPAKTTPRLNKITIFPVKPTSNQHCSNPSKTHNV